MQWYTDDEIRELYRRISVPCEHDKLRILSQLTDMRASILRGIVGCKTEHMIELERKYDYMLQLYYQGLIDKQIAEKIGMTKDYVQKWRAARGLKPNGKGGRPRKCQSEESKISEH